MFSLKQFAGSSWSGSSKDIRIQTGRLFEITETICVSVIVIKNRVGILSTPAHYWSIRRVMNLRMDRGIYEGNEQRYCCISYLQL